MHRNIKLLYAFKAIKTFLLIMPIIVPFFQELGLTQTQIYLLESAWAGTILLFEVPSGYFADKFGRKLSIILGSFLAVIAYSTYTFANNFEILLIANILMGFSYSFISGADTAMAFDSFAVNKKELEYLDFESRSTSYSGFSQVVASLLGGGLALISLKTPVIGQAVISFLAIPISFLLTETPHLMKAGPASFKELFEIGRNTLFERKDIQLYIFLSTIIGNMTHTIIWITQPLYQYIGIPLAYFGLLWSLQYLIYAISSRYSEKIELYLGRKEALIYFIAIGFLVYITLGMIPCLYTLPLILLLYAIRGAFKPIIANSINQLIKSEHRATVSSIESLVRKLFYALLGPIIGLVADYNSTALAFTFSGIIYGVSGLLLILQINRSKII